MAKVPKIRAWERFPGEPEAAFAAFGAFLLDSSRRVRAADVETSRRWAWVERRAAWEAYLLGIRQREELRLAVEGPRLRARGVHLASKALALSGRVVARHADAGDLLDLGDAETLTRVASRALDIATRSRALETATPPGLAGAGGVSGLSEEERDLLTDLLARAGV